MFIHSVLWADFYLDLTHLPRAFLHRGHGQASGSDFHCPVCGSTSQFMVFWFPTDTSPILDMVRA